MSKATKQQKLRPQLERFFLMLWVRDNNVDMWALVEKLTLRKISPEKATQVLFDESKTEKEILQFFLFIYEGRQELSWLIKDVHIHDLEPAEATKEAREYIKKFGK